jgi:hypothetical protein
MSGVDIRAATLGDVAAITRIYADAVTRGTATFEVEPPDEAEMTRRPRTLLAGAPLARCGADAAPARQCELKPALSRGLWQPANPARNAREPKGCKQSDDACMA